MFNQNVEALADGEGDYDKEIWIVYHREDGGFNCTRGGNETC